jgi:hypothetical protein
MGDNDIINTMIDTHLFNLGPLGVFSPADLLSQADSDVRLR